MAVTANTVELHASKTLQEPTYHQLGFEPVHETEVESSGEVQAAPF